MEKTFVTPAEFERLMGIKRQTRYNWKRDGILLEKVHWIKVKGKLMYRWHPDLPLELHGISEKLVADRKRKAKADGPRTGKDIGPNWDY